MKKLFQNAFFKECVIKLGSIYILLVILSFIFLEYRSSQAMSWANGFVFATHDKIAFVIFSLIFLKPLSISCFQEPVDSNRNY